MVKLRLIASLGAGLHEPMKITLKNYRCFPDSRPAQFEIGHGFTAMVGTNNSGKSSLLKFFPEFRALFQFMTSFSGNFMQALQPNSPAGLELRFILDVAEIFTNTNPRDLSMSFEVAADQGQPPRGPVPEGILVTVPKSSNSFQARIVMNLGQLEQGQFIVDESLARRNVAGQILADLGPYFSEFRALAETLYIGPFRNAINVGTKTDYFDIQVGASFIGRWRSLKTGNDKRGNELIMRITEDIARIFDFEQLEIDASDDGQTLQLFINRKSYKLPELGSGLTQFILVLGNAAIRQPSYILIDEPELNLHPSLMLDFLTTLGSYTKRGVIFCTHNIGLVRAAADRIYSLRKIAEGETQLTEYEATPRLSEFLGEMSFAGYRELGGERVLLVEGPTDVKTLQQFLRLHKKDHKVVMLSLGGASMINARSEDQLHEIKRISANISALIDSERDVQGAPLSPERQSFVEACANAGISCHVLERRATENYLSDRAVKQIKGDAYRSLHSFEKLKDASPTWAKSENWKIAREMTLNDLENTDLGSFLRSL
jgi:ABC-type branched-subunit amino acid transport system ATPase component